RGHPTRSKAHDLWRLSKSELGPPFDRLEARCYFRRAVESLISARKEPMNRKIPLLPLRELIVFPHEVVPLFVGREKSIHALEEAMAVDRSMLVCAQIKARINSTKPDGIHPIGTIDNVIKLQRLPDGTVKVLAEGKELAQIC